jgi:hypothetical protein
MKVALFALLMVAGCKSGVNERCQVQADCQDGLICGASTGVCEPQASGSGAIDASVPDGPPPDAAVDAAVDAASG